MNLFLARRIVPGPARGFARSVATRLGLVPDSSARKLLLVISGASPNWRGPGEDLYAADATFRAAIDRSDAIVRASTGFSSSAMFAGGWHAAGDAERQRGDVVRTGLLQLGLIDVLRAAGTEPHGIIAVSLGEIAAAYAAGALDGAAATRVLCSVARNLHPQTKHQVLLVLATGSAHAQQLCRSAPVPLHYAGEAMPGRSNVLADALHTPAIRSHLAANGVPVLSEHPSIWSYHIPETTADAAAIATDLSGISWRPPAIPVFLASLGGQAPPDHAFDARYWTWMAARPGRLGDASVACFAQGFDLLLNIGPFGVAQWLEEAARGLGRTVSVANATPAGSYEAAIVKAAGRSGRRYRPAPAPVAEDAFTPERIDLASPLVLRDRHGAYDALRRHGPVVYVARHDFWLVLGHEEVKAALADPVAYSNQPYEAVGPVLLAADPPDHAAVRRLTARYFTTAAFDRLRRSAVAQAGALTLPEMDLIGQFAAPIGQGMAADLLGFDGPARKWLAAEQSRLAAVDNGFPELCRVLDEAANRATMFTSLVEDGQGIITEAEARMLIRLLWLASTATTERLIASCVLALLDRPDLLAALRADADLVAPLVEEVLRLHPPEQMLPRVTRETVELGGVGIPAGALVQLSIAAANRDPRHLPEPGELRIDRGPNRHLGFGSGIHHCSGAVLARTVIPAVVAELIRLAPDLRAIQPPAAVPYASSIQWHYPTELIIATR